jgi:hypothetical protein
MAPTRREQTMHLLYTEEADRLDESYDDTCIVQSRNRLGAPLRSGAGVTREVDNHPVFYGAVLLYSTGGARDTSRRDVGTRRDVGEGSKKRRVNANGHG